MGSRKKLDDEILRDIVDYLEVMGYKTTIDAFQREKKKKQSRRKAPVNQSKNPASSEDIMAKLTKLYDNGNGVKVFEILNKSLTQSVKKKYSSLWFYMQVYFAIHPLLFTETTPQNISQKRMHVKKSMASFRNYLETSGVAKNSTFLPYYGLPYVADPMNHPSFAKLFTSEWVSDLRDRFMNFLLIEMKDNSGPRLQKVYRAFKEETKNNGINNVSLNVVNARLLVEAKQNERILLDSASKVNTTMNEMFRCSVQLFEQLSLVQNGRIEDANITDNYLKLIRQRLVLFNKEIQTAKQVISTTKSSSVEDIKEQESARRIAQQSTGDGHVARLINEHVTPFVSRQQTKLVEDEEDREQHEYHQLMEPSQEHLQQHKIVPYDNNNNDNKPAGRFNVVIAPLDYDRVAAGLAKLNSTQKASLLQALRWRLNRPGVFRQQREVLQQFINADVLQLHNNNINSDDLLSILLPSTDDCVKETSIRLINSMVSFADGRAYILKHDNIVGLLYEVLIGEGHIDTAIRQQALGALQKISLRRQPQPAMIGLGIMEWITQHVLLSDDSVSEYSREYGTALLMNLSLRTVGKKHCEKISLNVLAHLCNLLENDNAQVRTYVNGTLYSLLSRSSLVHTAKEMGMEGILTEIRDQAEHTFQRQIDCILQQLRTNTNPDDDDDDESNDEEDDAMDQDDTVYDTDDTMIEDEMEDEEMEDELIEYKIQGLQGEELLCSSYLAEGEKATMQLEEMAKTLNNQDRKNNNYNNSSNHPVPQRPITPGHQLRQSSRGGNSPNKKQLPPDAQEAFNSRREISRSPAHGERENKFFPNDEHEHGDELQSSNKSFHDSLPHHLRSQMNSVQIHDDIKGEEYDHVSPLRSQAAHTTSQRKIPPPKEHATSGESGNSNNNNDQPDEEYYNAFVSRAKVSRTPFSSVFAEPNEFK